MWRKKNIIEEKHYLKTIQIINMKKIKKKRENKLKFAVHKNQDLIIERLKEEWKEAEEIFGRQKEKNN